MEIKLEEIFYSGEKNSGLYSDVFYKNQGKDNDIAIYSSQKNILGFLPESLVKSSSIFKTKNAIIMYRKGNAGTLFLPFHNKWACSENAIPLILKEEYIDKIDLSYLITIIQDLIYERTTGKSDNANANWDMIKSIEINYNPDKFVITKYKLLEKMKKELSNFENSIHSIEKKQLVMNNEDRIILSKILEHTSRNDSLSEEGIYNSGKQLNEEDKKITVLSGSFTKFYGEVPFNEDIHLVNNKPCLQVITRGDAGKIRFLKEGIYATNTNSMLLTLKEEIKEIINVNDLEEEKIYLKFLTIYLSHLFEDYCSSSDLSVFALTEVLEQLSMPLIKLDKEIIDIVNRYEKIDEIENVIHFSIKEIDKILNQRLI